MHPFRRFVVSLAALALLGAASFAQQPRIKPKPPASKPAPALKVAPPPRVVAPTTGQSIAERITADELSDYLHFVASDEMEGRDTPSRGLNTTARFLAMMLARAGLKPAGDDGTFFQKIALKSEQVDPEKTTASLGDRALRWGDDFIAQRGGSGTASGALVFVGDGRVIPARQINAYQNVDVRGKILVVSGAGGPRGPRAAQPQGRRGEDWFDAETYAAKNGAVGIVRLPASANPQAWEQARRFAQRFSGGFQVERFQSENPAASAPSVPTVTVSPEVARALLEGERVTLEQALARRAPAGGENAANTPGEPAAPGAFDLAAGKKLSFTVVSNTEQATTQNVVAIVEGSDPVLKNEYVAFGAHYDHIGIGNPVNGDAINNGADDDGSGTVSLLAIAQAAARGPRPRRSLLFVWHAGEEHGLWGSQYFTTWPTVPLKQIVTQLNIDMIGRSKKSGDTNERNAELSGPNEIYVIGSRMLSAELGDLASRVNKSYRNLSFNYRYDDPDDPNGFYYRSDHYNYARKGIPIIFFFDGVHEDYHRPGDEPDKIDYKKMESVARTVFLTAWELANQPKRVVVDKPQETSATPSRP